MNPIKQDILGNLHQHSVTDVSYTGRRTYINCGCGTRILAEKYIGHLGRNLFDNGLATPLKYKGRAVLPVSIDLRSDYGWNEKEVSTPNTNNDRRNIQLQRV
jgi:hypothetical protein